MYDGRVIGRTSELVAIRSFVELPPTSLHVLVLAGEAGIGKTTLWDLGVEAARSAGLTVLLARPAESERVLPYAALGDLLEPVLERYSGALAGVQRQALDSALQRTASDAPAAELAVARATLALLRGLVADGSALIAVDDVQWLDAPSARTVEFALRRLRDTPLKLLLALRDTEDPKPALDLEWSARSGGLTTVVVGPLDTTALDELVRTQLDLRLTRPQVLRLKRTTGGNPYFALEIARSMAESGELTVPPSLRDALAERIGALSAEAQDSLLLAAACIQATPELVERAAGARSGLEQVLALGLLDRDGPRLRFSHPLLPSVVYERALPSERRGAHRRLAAVAMASEERAVHLARGHEARNAAIAAELEEVAAAAAARGGPGLAAELAEAAARLTPAADETSRTRRLLAAAEYHEAEGDPGRARMLLEQLMETLPAGPERAGVLRRLADSLEDSPMEELIALCDQALTEAKGDAALTAEIHTTLAAFCWIAGSLEQSLEHSRASIRYAEEAGDDTRLAVSIGDTCNSEALLALPWDREAMARALEIEPRVDDLPPWLRPSYQLATIAIVTDELETARPLLAAELERARRIGSEPGVLHLLLRVVDLELRAGSWATALRTAREAHALARQGGLDVEEATAGTLLALVLAHLGELDEARSLAEAAYRVSDDRGHRGIAIRSAGALGFVELSDDRLDAALEWLTPARKEIQAMGIGELSISGVVQNEIDALVAVGRLEDAVAVVGFVEEKGRPAERSWHRVVAARGRALVASAQGDAAAARAAIEEALAAQDTLPQPFELARTRLAAGAVDRRAKRWAAARRHFTAALELLDDLGAARWAETAASALARLPARRPRGTDLTETERRIAELVAEGLANKEVAARMFVSVRTVEANLSRVYAKLGVRSRTELVRKLAG